MHLLRDAIVLLAVACVAVPLFKRLKLGAILGYLCAGVAVGPHALGMVGGGESLLHFSELGVVFFLFLVGLELEPRRLWELRRAVFGLGAAQLAATAALIAVPLVAFGMPTAAAVVAGLGLALSSTAIALQLLAERGVAHARAGRDGFAVLLFQDLAVIPLLAAVPLLAGSGQSVMSVAGTALAFAKVIGMVALIVIGGRLITRPLFRMIASSKAHEISVAVALLIVVGAGGLMTLVGLSMGMGAFLAGVLLADSEYRHELEANVEPFKGLLLGLFFIAIGMTANVGLYVEKPLVIAGGVAGLILVKALVLFVLGKFAKWEDLKSRLLVSVSMSQGGEFGFVLFAVAAKAGAMAADIADALVIVVSTSMALSPLAMLGADAALKQLEKRRPKRAFDSLEDASHPVIIAGFGRYGQIIARILTAAGFKYTALEVAPEQVDFVRKFGNLVFYGDASRLDLLRAAKAEEASAFVLAIDDIEASVRTAATVKKNFPSLPIYARARNRNHAYKLLDLGVTVLNRETFFSSAKMAEEVLVGLGFERDDAVGLVATFVKADEDLLRRQHAVHHDEQQLVQTAKASREELQAIFEQDAARRAQRKAERDGAGGSNPPPPPAGPGETPPTTTAS